jgi:hypothetical protein
MAANRPAQDLYEDPPHERTRKLLVFVGTLLLLAVIGALGWWGFDFFYWSVRVPQERELTDRHGQKLQVEIEGRSETMVGVTVLKDKSARLLALANLADADQQALGRIEPQSKYSFPQPYTFTDAAGKAQPVRLDGRSGDLLKWTGLADNVTHWMPIAELAPEDKNFVLGLPMSLLFTYPVDVTLIDTAGQSFPASVLARSKVLVRYKTGAGDEALVPAANLSPATQAQLNIFPDNLVITYPLVLTLTDKAGRKRTLGVTARAEEAIQVAASGGTDLLVPIAALSDEDQAVMRALRVNLSLEYPYAMTLADQQKHLLQVTLVGRTEDAVQFTRAGDSKTYSYAIARLSPTDQAVVRLFPVGGAAK